MEDPKNIIVRMPNWIGDLVMGVPVLKDLRDAFPKASITAMCMHPIAHVMDKDPSINELFCFQRKRGAERRVTSRNVIEKLVNGKYDLGLLLPNSFSSAWLFWQGKVGRRIGFKGNFRSPLLTDALSFPEKRKTQHLVMTYKALLAPLGIKESETLPKLFVDEQEKEDAWELLKTYGIEKEHLVIGINPGAAYGSAKCWLPERFSELATKLVQVNSNIRIVFFGSGEGVELVRQICRDLPSGVVNLAGATSLRELMAIIANCNLFLTNDSGPMHIADALEVPLVALFGSTDPVVTGPYRQGQVIQKDVSCSPCFKRRCPIDFPCMKKIETEDVYRAVMEVIESCSNS